MRYVVMVLLGLLLAMAGVQPAMAANCGGLPASGGVIPAGTYTLTDSCEATSTFEILAGSSVTINGGGRLVSGEQHGGSTFSVESGATLIMNQIAVWSYSTSDVTIVNFGELVLTDAALDGEVGTILNQGTATITNAVFSLGAGQAIYNSGVFSLTNAWISGGTSIDGGAIYNEGTFTLNQVNLLGNHASNEGNAIYNTNMMDIINSTISENGNVASGNHTIWNSGTINFIQSTLVDNKTDEIWNEGTVNFQSSILTGDVGNIRCAGTGAFSDLGSNIENTNTCGLVSGSNTDPLVGRLGWNYQLLSGSPAIDAAPNCTGLTKDQLGVARPQGSACDIGSIEQILTASCPGLPVTGGVLPGGTYTLAADCVLTDTLIINESTVINGDGFALDGSNSRRVLHIFTNYEDSVDVELNNIVIRNGNGLVTGGGIYFIADSLVITDSIIEGNTGFGDTGGLSHVGHNIQLENVVIRNNQSVFDAGGIVVGFDGLMSIANSSIQDNTSYIYGGGILNSGYHLEIINTTIKGNTAPLGGAVYSVYAEENNINTLSIINSTVSDNSSGIYSEYALDIVELKNSIIANNAGENCTGIFTDLGGNLENTNTCGLSTGANTDPMLGTFNGEYFPLSAGSPAIDGAPDCAGLTEDQIGTSRPQGGACDIGAIEVAQAVAACPGLPVDGGVIPAGTYTLTGNCVITSPLEVSAGETVTIDGGGFALDGSDTHQVMRVNPTGTLNLSDTTIQNGSAADGGGLVNDNGIVVLNDVTFQDNNTTLSGGGFANLGAATLTDVTFIGNTAGEVGGAIFTANDDLIVNNALFLNNSATLSGGAIANSFNAQVMNATFYQNSATNGGAIFVDDGATLTVTHNTISGNSSGIHNLSGTVSLQNSVIAGNIGLNCTHTVGGIFIDLWGNLEDTETCGLLIGYNTDPILGTFNGEYFPTTQGSPVIDGAPDCAGLTEDQVGNPRPRGTACDIGAYEVDLSSATCPGLPVTGGAIPSGTYTLTADCVTTGTLVIDNGETVTINGDDFALIGTATHRVMAVEAGGTLVVNNTIFRNGNSGIDGGAGIFNFGNLSVTDSVFHHNQANNAGSGIWNSGIATISNSTFHNNTGGGGSLFNDGTLLTAIDTLIYDNDGAWGGVYNITDMTLIRVSIFNNTAGDAGGGIVNYSDPFNAPPTTATLNIINSTITGNVATYDATTEGGDPSMSSKGGGIWNNGTLNITNVTLADNHSVGDGNELWNEGTVKFRNTIISGNIAEVTCAGSGSYVDQGGNLENTNTCGLSTGANTDPILGTFTGEHFLLLAGSPAIDAAPDCAGLTEDQIGTSRPQGSACDIGAIEYVPPCPGLPVSGGIIPAGIYTLTDSCVLSSTLEVASDDTVTIDGNGYTLSGDLSFTVLNVAGTLNLSDAVITEGNSPTDGGGIYNTGTTNLVNVDIIRNYSQSDGGGIFNSGFMNLSQLFIAENAASLGGGISNVGGEIVISNVTIYMNSALHGEAIFNSENGTASLNNVTLFEMFQATAIYNNANLNLRNSILYGIGLVCGNDSSSIINDLGGNLENGDSCRLVNGSNVDPHLGTFNGRYFRLLDSSPALDAAPNCAGLSEDQIGTSRPLGDACDIGAIEMTVEPDCPGLSLSSGVIPEGTYTLTGDCITGDMFVIDFDTSVTIDGGGFSLIGNNEYPVFMMKEDSTLNISNMTIQNGYAIDGGGIANYDGMLIADNVIFQDNVALNNGGGIYNRGPSVLTDVMFFNNSAQQSGGGIYGDYPEMSINRAIFMDNSALKGGAIGIYSQNNTVSINNATFTQNDADHGGALYAAYSNNVNLAHSTIMGNSSGIYNESSVVTLKNAIIAGNTNTNCTGTITDQGGNLENTNTCGLSSGANTDPMLGTFTGEYFLLLAGSPAIDAAPDCAGLAEDQIGTSRPQGSACDIGAIEVVQAVEPPINFQITEQQLFDAMQADMLANPSEIDFILADFVPGAINFTVRTTDGTVTLVTMSIVVEGDLSRWEITSMNPSTQQTVIQQHLPGIVTRSLIALTVEVSVITDIDDTYLYITGEG